MAPVRNEIHEVLGFCVRDYSSLSMIWGLGQHVNQVGTVLGCLLPCELLQQQHCLRAQGWNPGPTPADQRPPRRGVQTLPPWSAALAGFQGFTQTPCAQFRHLGQALESVTSLPKS